MRKRAQDVSVDTLLEVDAAGGDLLGVRVTSPAGGVPGRRQHGSWRATERLEPGTAYVVRARVRGADGPVVRERRFRTAGETVGVGMPVVVQFDLPVTDRAAMEPEMAVESTPRQAGEYLKAWGPLDRVAGGRGSCRWGPGAAGVGATGPQRLFSPVHRGVFTHVVVAGVDPDGVVHDAVHDRVGVHS